MEVDNSQKLQADEAEALQEMLEDMMALVDDCHEVLDSPLSDVLFGAEEEERSIRIKNVLHKYGGKTEMLKLLETWKDALSRSHTSAWSIEVQSESSDDKTYLVRYSKDQHEFPHDGFDYTCSCPSFEFGSHPGKYCKHIDAITDFFGFGIEPSSKEKEGPVRVL